MKKTLPNPALVACVLVFTSGAAMSQPLPLGSLNQSDRGAALTESPVALATMRETCTNDLCLEVTLSEFDPDNPDACGTQNTLEAVLGEQVNICYRLTNHTSTTLRHHSLVDEHAGTVFVFEEAVVPPHGSHQYNRVIIATNTQGNTTGPFNSTWTAYDELPSYVSDDTADADFNDISTTGTALNLGDDDIALVTMPFEFTFYDRTGHNLCVGNNGGVIFGVETCPGSHHYGGHSLPTSVFSDPAILPFWDDLFTGGNVYYETVGSAPERRFIVQWHNKDYYGNWDSDPDGITFQLVLNETDGGLRFEYEDTTFGSYAAGNSHGATAVSGLQMNITLADQYSAFEAVLTEGLSIAWSPVPITELSVETGATLDVDAPVLITVPDAGSGFSVTVPAESSGQEVMHIGNTGMRDLSWSFELPSSRAHFPDQPRAIVSRQDKSIPEFAAPGHVPGKSSAAPVNPLAGAGVPAYATQPVHGGVLYVSLDLTDPSESTLISSDTGSILAGAFVGYDFSQQYGMTFDTAILHTIDTQTGETTLIGPTGLADGPSVIVVGMSWDPTTDNLYAIEVDHPNNLSSLYLIDRNTADATLIGTIPSRRIFDIAIDPSGLMYGLDIINDVLVAIDKATAETQAIGSTGLDLWFSQGLDFDAETGILYLTGMDGSFASAYTVDPFTGQASLIGSLERETAALAIAKPGPVCGTPDWLSTDADSGVLAPDPEFANPDEVTLTFDTTGLTPGNYETLLCLYSNDPQRRRVMFPVTLTVTQAPLGDPIFRDRFEIASP